MVDSGVATVAAPAAGNPSSTAVAAPPPSPAAQPANGKTDRTTPATPYREVIDRLGKGESPQAIRKDLHSRTTDAPANGAQPAANTPVQSASAVAVPPPSPSQPDASAGAKDETYGLTDKELNAIKRQTKDLSFLAMMPISNRKAIAKWHADTAAEADRRFQQASQGKNPDGTPIDQANPTTSQEATPGTKDGNATPAEPGKPAAQQAAPDSAALFAPFKVSEARSTALNELGGKAAVDAMSGLADDITAHVSGQVAQVMKLVSFTLERFERTDFSEALDALKKQPGLENLNEEQVKQLRDEARNLIVAKGDPMSYGWKNAVPIAAAGLFQQNVQQAAQAALLQSRQQSLNAAPDKGDQRVAQTARPMTMAQRTKAIGQYMQAHPGVEPRDAAKAVDAAT